MDTFDLSSDSDLLFSLPASVANNDDDCWLVSALLLEPKILLELASPLPKLSVAAFPNKEPLLPVSFEVLSSDLALSSPSLLSSLCSGLWLGAGDDVATSAVDLGTRCFCTTSSLAPSNDRFLPTDLGKDKECDPTGEKVNTGRSSSPSASLSESSAGWTTLSGKGENENFIPSSEPSLSSSDTAVSNAGVRLMELVSLAENARSPLLSLAPSSKGLGAFAVRWTTAGVPLRLSLRPTGGLDS